MRRSGKRHANANIGLPHVRIAPRPAWPRPGSVLRIKIRNNRRSKDRRSTHRLVHRDMEPPAPRRQVAMKDVGKALGRVDDLQARSCKGSFVVEVRREQGICQGLGERVDTDEPADQGGNAEFSPVILGEDPGVILDSIDVPVDVFKASCTSDRR